MLNSEVCVILEVTGVVADIYIESRCQPIMLITLIIFNII